MFHADTLDAALRELGAVLAAEGQQAELVVIGGGALLLLGLTARITEDCDIVAVIEDADLRTAKPLPPATAKSSHASPNTKWPTACRPACRN